ncbi:hypothetical protein BGX29_000024 [Mortierella sp. GBA35]|nr:hypothetical protein BGX29_000024 [Mortierella sp. GBA35]
MSSAAERFFNIPELTYMVAVHLNKHHTAMLVQTSRRLRQQCEPLLYNNLTLNYSPDLANLFEYPGATRALARSVCHVKQLELSVLDVVALFNCMLAYPDETEDSSDDTQGLRPEWLPSADPESKHVVPVPPMTNLERLKITYSYGPTCPYYLPILAKSISGLSRLYALTLVAVVSRKDVWARVGQSIFASCSPSVRTLVPTLEERPISIWTKRPQELEMWSLGRVTSEQELLSVLEYCPKLERLALPGIQAPSVQV